MTTKIWHPLLALIASATDKELARHVEFLKEENEILRWRIPSQVPPFMFKGLKTQLAVAAMVDVLAYLNAIK